ncbi:argininosuccinate lyase [Clostridium sp. D2Q-14]|uniref:argininosuccinate lyase n=1 Tax=Anaeromonas gelatinilytica TaxID=2683194 RepID=UPI00193C3777|nr:argininosuccinate lyase [Anaeromonas gelatinilytica]MBS4535333.1 argininosuccinate lyase [Anaeromonas gelatinilytica]
MKLWGSRFTSVESKLMEDFNSSLGIDKILYEQDIKGSIAHVQMLSKCGILSKEEEHLLIKSLKEIQEEIENENLIIEGNYEDIHSFIETKLVGILGDTGKKLHTARSRNDQVAVDMKLYAKLKVKESIYDLEQLINVLKELGEKNEDVIMPGYTHLQRAQVVTFKYHLLAYVSMFERDIKRLENAIKIFNESPLGCCALAGTTYSIDRKFTAKKLGFSGCVDNFLDGVSDRDYLIEIVSAFSIIMIHLSRLCEELILWNSNEFDFIEISDMFATGSSIMPQKKNPDAAELIRGKTGRVYGSLISLLTIMKALPLAYNKDMQEDKEPFFDSVKTVQSSLKIMAEMLKSLEINKNKMKKAVKTGFLNATEVVDYLVLKGMPFREAHGLVGSVVLYCEEKNKTIEELKLNELNQFSDLFDKSIYDYIKYENSLKKGIKKEMK